MHMLFCNMQYLRMHLLLYMELQEIDIVFSGVIEIHEMTMQLQAALEDCLEMAEENRDDNEGTYSCPNIGVCFLDLAEVILHVLSKCYNEVSQVTSHFGAKL